MSLTSLVVAAKATHTATVVWVHGLGDSGAGWSFLADELSNLFPYVKWVLPNAPVRRVSMNGGVSVPAWFDVARYDLNGGRIEDESGMMSTVTSLKGLINKEIDQGISPHRIVVGGFSQGCVMSLLTGLTSDHTLGGIIGCSGWLGQQHKFPNLASNASKKTPILVCHGDSDPVVEVSRGIESAKLLKSFGYNVTTKIYPGLPHSASPQEINDIAQFLQERIPPIASDSHAKDEL